MAAVADTATPCAGSLEITRLHSPVVIFWLWHVTSYVPRRLHVIRPTCHVSCGLSEAFISWTTMTLISLIVASIDNLQARREHLTQQFFVRSVLHAKLYSPIRNWMKNHICTTCCLFSMTWTLWTDSAMHKHLNYHRHEPRDLDDRLFHAVLLITNSSYVISFFNFFILIYCMYILFFRINNPAIAAIPNKPFYIGVDVRDRQTVGM